MTKAQAAELQVKWKQQDPPRLCEHPKIDIERNEDGYVTGNYRCRECGEAIVRTYKSSTFSEISPIDWLFVHPARVSQSDFPLASDILPKWYCL